MSSLSTGVIIRSTGSWYQVKAEAGNIIDCKLKGSFKIRGIRNTNPLAVGDVVSFRFIQDKEIGLIEKIYKRKNYIIRKATKLSKASHIIASNIDQAILITSLVKPRTTSGFIDRFLVTAEAYHIPVLLVFNKYDLYEQEEKLMLKQYENVYGSIGYKIITTSVKSGLNLNLFTEALKNKTSMLSGHSGVGKSAMINYIDPTLNLKEGEISQTHAKGKHTTTFAAMFPLSFGGNIIDTPGIKEFGLVGFEKEELGQRFPEMRSRMNKCKFNNCLHVNEPGCAIRSAVENGEIAAFRYKNYLNMLSELE